MLLYLKTKTSTSSFGLLVFLLSGRCKKYHQSSSIPWPSVSFGVVVLLLFLVAPLWRSHRFEDSESAALFLTYFTPLQQVNLAFFSLPEIVVGLVSD